MKIAGNRTDTQWKLLKKHLQSNPSQSQWDDAYNNYYRARIFTRYLNPITSITRHDRQIGEGFAIVALFCTLIEYLESIERGDNFHFIGRTKSHLQPHEYSERQAATYFKEFLLNRIPFCTLIPKSLVDSFYQNVRCGLLHEARTKGGWIISTRRSDGQLISQGNGIIILNRNELIPALEIYFSDYHRRLISEDKTQKAFIQKFDFLCSQ
jgi:hypothetical protein